MNQCSWMDNEKRLMERQKEKERMSETGGKGSGILDKARNLREGEGKEVR